MQEVFSTLSQSGSRYWRSQSLWLSIDMPCQAIQCHAMGLKQSMLGAGGHGSHPEHPHWSQNSLNSCVLLDVHQWCKFRVETNANANRHVKHIHTHQTEQDVLLAAVSKDLRLVTHRYTYTHMYACERTSYKHKIHTDLWENHVLID